MPCGHTDTEYMSFSKTERRILNMIFELKYSRQDICAALEIEDSTFRYHLANIKRRQAQMRREKAERETETQQRRQAEKYLPETKQDQPIPISSSENEPPPIRPVSRPPSIQTRSPFVESDGTPIPESGKDRPGSLTRSIFGR